MTIIPPAGTKSKPDFLEIALRESQESRRVFPCSGKIPAIPGGKGVLDATTDEVTIVEWYAHYPNANVGVGFFADSEEVGVDVDLKNLPKWREYEAQYGEVDTRIVETGSGGFHYYFRKPTGIKLVNIEQSSGLGFELKVNGKYLLAPGSIHPVTGRAYRVIKALPPAEMPDWLINLCQQKGERASLETQQGRIPRTQHDSFLASQAGSYRHRGDSKEAIIAKLRIDLGRLDNVDPSRPYTEKDLARIAGSISRYSPSDNPTGSKQNKNDLEPTELIVKSVAEIIAESVSWLWYPYIPLGKLTLLEGDPGVGKSWLALALATAISLGQTLPGGAKPDSGIVLIASAEDGLADTIKPRLAAMEADQSNIRVVSGLFTLNETGFQMLDVAMADCCPALLIIDPLVAYLSGSLDINKANQVRFATARLAALAETYHAAVIAVRHLTKGGSQKPIYRGLGSVDFTAAARSVLMAGADPDNESDRAIIHIKSNLAPVGGPVGYELRDGGFYWKDTTTLTYERITAQSNKGALQDAEDFLREVLADGAALANEITAEATRRGIAPATLRRAADKDHLNVESFRQGELGKRGGGKWHWRLPGGD